MSKLNACVLSTISKASREICKSKISNSFPSNLHKSIRIRSEIYIYKQNNLIRRDTSSNNSIDTHDSHQKQLKISKLSENSTTSRVSLDPLEQPVSSSRKSGRTPERKSERGWSIGSFWISLWWSGIWSTQWSEVAMNNDGLSAEGNCGGGKWMNSRASIEEETASFNGRNRVRIVSAVQVF